MKKLLILILITTACTLAQAALTVDPPADNDMFLQRKKANPLSGQASPGAKIEVECQGQKVSATADAAGQWKLTIPAIEEAGGPYNLTIKSGEEKVEFTNVLIGDIWLCSGQSNMWMEVQHCLNPEQELATIDQPKIRLLRIKIKASQTPVEKIEQSWTICDLKYGKGFPAVGFFFGRKVVQEADIPIGLIANPWYGVSAQAFTRREALLADPDSAFIVAEWDKKMLTFPEDLKKFNDDEPRRMAEWQKRADAAKAANEKAPSKTSPPQGPDSSEGPGNVWNGMVHPLVSQPITGVLWYQGEANAPRAYKYRPLLKTLIKDWRAQWNQGDFPFYIVQLPNFLEPKSPQGVFEKETAASGVARQTPPLDSSWAETREAQAMALTLPNTAVAVSIDVGDRDALHPKNKRPIGERMARSALNQVYGKKMVDEGPTFERMEIKDGQVTIHLRSAEGLHTKDGQSVKGYAIAGEDRKFVWADASIAGDTIVLKSAEVPAPVAVRYAWADNPETNLYNGADLPAAPFRTDEWPGITAKK